MKDFDALLCRPAEEQFSDEQYICSSCEKDIEENVAFCDDCLSLFDDE